MKKQKHLVQRATRLAASFLLPVGLSAFAVSCSNDADHTYPKGTPLSLAFNFKAKAYGETETVSRSPQVTPAAAAVALGNGLTLEAVMEEAAGIGKRDAAAQTDIATGIGKNNEMLVFAFPKDATEPTQAAFYYTDAVSGVAKLISSPVEVASGDEYFFTVIGRNALASTEDVSTYLSSKGFTPAGPSADELRAAADSYVADVLSRLEGTPKNQQVIGYDNYVFGHTGVKTITANEQESIQLTNFHAKARIEVVCTTANPIEGVSGVSFKSGDNSVATYLNLATGQNEACTGTDRILIDNSSWTLDAPANQETSPFFLALPYEGAAVDLHIGSLTIDGTTYNNHSAGFDIHFAKQLQRGYSYTFKVNVKAIPPEFAASNIYYDGTELTFKPVAWTPAAGEPDARKYMGLYFKWGSIVGIAPQKLAGSPILTNNTLYAYVYNTSSSAWVKDYVQTFINLSTPGFSSGKYGGGIPYIDTNLSANRNINAIVDDFAYNRGDICRFLGTINPSLAGYRMPTINELGTDGDVTDAGDPPYFVTTPVLGGWTRSASWTRESGSGNGVYGATDDGMTSFNNAFFKNSDVRFPITGYDRRSASGGIPLPEDNPGTDVGTPLGMYWSASAQVLNSYTLEFNGRNIITNRTSGTNVDRQYARPIRCVKIPSSSPPASPVLLEGFGDAIEKAQGGYVTK